MSMYAQSVAELSGLDVIKSSELDIQGSSFGERLACAFEKIYSKGYSQVIAIGNDCPDLTVEDINLSQDLLNKGQSVLGPDQRGGVFLIGLGKDQFIKDEFTQIAWQTNQLFEGLLNFLPENTLVLEKKEDINSEGNLTVWLSHRFVSIARIIIEILNQKTPNAGRSFDLASSTLERFVGLRAPPSR